MSLHGAARLLRQGDKNEETKTNTIIITDNHDGLLWEHN